MNWIHWSLLSALFLRERLTPQHLIGGALIAAGAVVIAWRN
jgi:drug/metabolite transporter (DMT)-like permease